MVRIQDLQEGKKYTIEFPNGDIIDCKLKKIIAYSDFGADYVFKKKKGERNGPVHPTIKNGFILNSELMQVVHILIREKEGIDD